MGKISLKNPKFQKKIKYLKSKNIPPKMEE
jgi:hypothetical protein